VTVSYRFPSRQIYLANGQHSPQWYGLILTEDRPGALLLIVRQEPTRNLLLLQ
jgi:hypothetical protein